METWILIIYLVGIREDTAIDHIEYTSKAKCLEAARVIEEGRDNRFRGKYPVLVYTCTKK